MSGEYRDPSFKMDKDVIMRSSEGLGMSDSTKGLNTIANVILLSYNRPRMLREAIDSVRNGTYQKFQIWIADDGSDFDVAELAGSYKDDRIGWIQREKITPEERATRSRIAENINALIEQIPGEEMIYYLCDDDLFDKDWLARSITCIEHSPTYHVVTGESHYFFDGEDPDTESKPGIPLEGEGDSAIPRMWWGLGSFAHRGWCWHKESVKWYDSYYGHSIDTNFISDLWFTHQQYLIVDKPAVYRREHERMLSAKLGRKDASGRYLAGAIPPPLRPEHVSGEME